MKTKYSLITFMVLVFLNAGSVFAQQTKFTKVFYDVIGAVQAYSIVKTADNNFMIAGEKDEHAFAMKLDPSGSVAWSKLIGGLHSEFYTATATSDSSVVLAGHCHNTATSGSDVYCVKTKVNGDTAWTRSFDLGYDETAYSIKQTMDHGFIITGDDYPNNVFIVKLDSSGNLTWGRIFIMGDYIAEGSGIEQAPDSGYILTGFFSNYSPFEETLFLMKLTADGNVSWTKRQVLTGNHNSYAVDIRAVPDGIVVLSSESSSGIFLMKTDFSGNVIWSKNYPENDGVNKGSSSLYRKLHSTSDGGYIFIRSSFGSFGRMNKVDSVGNALWLQELDLSVTDFAETNDGGYMVVGNGPLLGVIMGQTLNPQVGVMKTDSLGNSSSCSWQWSVTSGDIPVTLSDMVFTPTAAGMSHFASFPVTNLLLTIDTGCVAMTGHIRETTIAQPSITIYPNPSNGSFQVTSGGTTSDEITTIEVFNTIGSMIFTSSDPVIIQSEIKLNPAPDGVYMARILTGDQEFWRKLVIFK